MTHLYALPLKTPVFTWSWKQHLTRLSVILLVKACVFAYFVLDTADMERIGRWALWTSDSIGYVGPAESLLANGTYQDDHRMPGFALPFYVLRLFLSKPLAADAITILQCVVASVSIHFLALALALVVGRKQLYVLAAAALVLAFFPARAELELMTDSLCISAMSMHLAFLVFHFRGRGRAWLPLSGLMLTWAVFLRPIYAALFPLELMLLAVYTSGPWRARLLTVLAFLAPWCAIDGAWIARNYSVYGEIRPLTNGLYPRGFSTAHYYAMMQFVQTYGGNYNYWDPTSDLRWYGYREDLLPGQDPLSGEPPEPPAHAYASTYDRDSLLALRRLITRAREPAVPQQEWDSLVAEVWSRTERYRAALREERPFQYHVTSRLRLLGHLVVHSGSSIIFRKATSEMGLPELALKVLQSGIHWFAMIMGVIAAVVVLVRERGDHALVFWGLIALYGIFIHPFVMRVCEIRYLGPTFPITLSLGLWLTWRWAMRSNTFRRLFNVEGDQYT